MCFILDKTERTDYDPFHRNPQFCHADNECTWELSRLAAHFHPTVALFAKQLLKVMLTGLSQQQSFILQDK